MLRSPRAGWTVPGAAAGLAVACLLSGAAARADGPLAPAAPVITTSSTLPAGTQGPDIIFLKNGGVVRGTIVEAIPDRPARIQLVTGEIWSIAWMYVDHVTTGASSAASPSPAPPVPSGPMVTLHVDAPRTVDIVGHPGPGTDWIAMCTGACDKPVPAGWEYQARGADMRASAPFALRTSGGAATVHVDPGTKSAFTLGIVGVCVGGPISFVGLIVTAVGAAGHVTQTVNGVTTTQPVSPSTLPVGLGILGVGLAAVVAGGIVALDNASTGVTQPAARTALAPSPSSHFVDAAREAPRLPDVATSPLVELTF